MKKLLILMIIIISSMNTYSQQDSSIIEIDTTTIDTNVYQPMNNVSTPKPHYWRTISFGSLSGLTVSGYYLQTFSMAISYELKKDWSINSWSGINYNYSYSGGWFSTQITTNKQVKGFNGGGGVMYGAGAIGSPFPEGFYMNDLSFILTVSKRFKLP